MNKVIIRIIALTFLIFSLDAYNVVFEGVSDPQLLKTLKNHSELLALKEYAPASLQALEYRAQNDIPGLMRTLHALGYYDAILKVRVEEVYKDSPVVIVSIDLGVQYRIGSFDVTLMGNETLNEELKQTLNYDKATLHVGDSANSLAIIDAEEDALKTLANLGYPLAKIVDKKIVVDGKTKTVLISFKIDKGKLCYFGALTLQGNPHIKALFIENKIAWKENEVFSREKINETQKALLDTGLFSAVEITPDTSGESDHLPIVIQLTESKFRSISFGASYQTHWGAGGNLAWENRNVGAVGSRLHLEVDVTQKSHTGIVSYIVPDFKKLGQDLVFQAEASQANVSPSYDARTYNLLGRLDKKVSQYFSTSIGAGGEKLYVNGSVSNGNFWLAMAPFYLRYNTTNSLLNPSSGFKSHYHAKPYFNFSNEAKPFIYQEARLSTYQPFLNDYIVIAHLFTLSSILSYKLSDVPVAKRIFGSNEENLRGYKFQTVSPLNHDNKPIGGRGGFFYSLELRLRLNKSFGVVPFFDMGRVTRVPYPSVVGKWYKAVGVGFRYYSFFGPFRVDIGFPLDPREGIDNRFRFLASIGQTF